MSYPATTWSNGDVITAANLNNIESGITANDSAIAAANTAIATKASTADMTAALATKANTSDMTTALAAKADTTAVEAALATKAEIDGSYEGMTVGNAEQLVATVGVEDKVPYQFRTSGGSADIGDREVDKLVGGTIAWNQKIQNGNFTDNTKWSAVNGSFSVASNVCTFVPTLAVAYARQLLSRETHRYFASCEIKCSSGKGFIAWWGGYGNAQINIPMDGTWKRVATVLQAASADSSYNIDFGVHSNTNLDTFELRNCQLIDLTQMFGTAIADYIYSLETTTAGAGVAWFRKLFPKPYYAYNAGELMSVSGVASHDMTGFNQFDKSTATANGTLNSEGNVIAGVHTISDYIPVLPSTVYYASHTVSAAVGRAAFTYDSNKTAIALHYPEPYAAARTAGQITTEANAAYIRLAFTDADAACFNLSWDGSRDGEYEPYVKRSYPLDSTLTLRGIPKLDSNNELYYDGDTYESDGTVTRRYGSINLGEQTWSRRDSDGLLYTSTAVVPTALTSSLNVVCPKYSAPASASRTGVSTDEGCVSVASGYIYVKDNNYSTAAAFKTAMSGVYLVYELAEPTTESADPYQNPQVVDDFGTEQYVTTSIVPVGHETQYQANLRAKLEMAPNSPEGNGDYIVRQSNGVNTYVPITFPADELPAAPTTNGNYVLKCTVSNGTATFTWASA